MENWRLFRERTLKEHDTGWRTTYAKKAKEFNRHPGQRFVRGLQSADRSPYYEDALRAIAAVRFRLHKELAHGRRKQAFLYHLGDIHVEGRANSKVAVAKNYDENILPVLHAGVANTAVRFSSQRSEPEDEQMFGTWDDRSVDHSRGGGYGVVDLNLDWFLNARLSPFKSHEERMEALKLTVYHELNHMIDFLFSTEKVKYSGKATGREDETAERDRLLSTSQMKIIQEIYGELMAVTQGDLDLGRGLAYIGKNRTDYPEYKRRPWEVWAHLYELFYQFPKGIKEQDLKEVCEWRELDDQIDEENLKLDMVKEEQRLRKNLNRKGWSDLLLDHNDFVGYMACEKIHGGTVIMLNQIASLEKELPSKIPGRTATAE